MAAMTEQHLPPSKKVTASDVARAAGCSQASVSKVINNQPHVSEYLRQKVLEQVRRLNYKYRHGTLQQLAIILPAPWQFRLDGYVASLLNAMVYVLYQRGIQMEIIQENDLEMLKSRTIDGAISISWEPKLTTDWFELFSLPLVRINANPALSRPDSLLAHVNGDGEKSMQALLARLYSLGHRNILLLAPGPLEIEARRTRYKGFVDFLKSHHIQHPEKSCIFNVMRNSFDQTFSSLKQAISNGATALIAVGEGSARDVLTLVDKLNLNIPKRVSVICWEQKQVLPYFDPPIAGMAMDYTLLSETAVDTLAALCRGENVSDIYLPFQLIERGSVGPVFHRKSEKRLTERILEILAEGPRTRVGISSALDIKPYCGYFNRALRELLDEKKIVYQKGLDRKRLLALSTRTK